MRCSRRPLDRPRPVKILRLARKSRSIWSVEFEDQHASSASPGQFLMIYVPGRDEIPLGVADIEGEIVTLVVKVVGDCTKALCESGEGELVGVRGPYGNGFRLSDGKALLVGGGVGVAPLILLAKRLRKRATDILTIVGAPTAEEVVFAETLSAYSEVRVVTEDGSAGEKGLACDIAQREITQNQFDSVYVCGPEAMMVRLVDLCTNERIHVQASLERWIKCAVGLCGSCVLDPLGLRVCVDGPVFTGDQLSKVTDFGRFYRRASGLKALF